MDEKIKLNITTYNFLCTIIVYIKRKFFEEGENNIYPNYDPFSHRLLTSHFLDGTKIERTKIHLNPNYHTQYIT